jgi:hypothetical protein
VRGPAPMSVDRVKTMFTNRGYVPGATVSISTASWPTCIAAPLQVQRAGAAEVALAHDGGACGLGRFTAKRVTSKSSANGITLGNPGPRAATIIFQQTGPITSVRVRRLASEQPGGRDDHADRCHEGLFVRISATCLAGPAIVADASARRTSHILGSARTAPVGRLAVQLPETGQGHQAGQGRDGRRERPVCFFHGRVSRNVSGAGASSTSSGGPGCPGTNHPSWSCDLGPAVSWPRSRPST